MKSKGTNVEIPISNSQKCAKLTMNSHLSIRARQLLLQKVSPNVPVFSKNGKLVDVMEIIGKEFKKIKNCSYMDRKFLLFFPKSYPRKFM